MRNVIVTGGSRGIGLRTASRLVAQGDRVIAIARRRTQELSAAIEECRAAGTGGLSFCEFDLADIDGIGALVHKLYNQFGPIGALVNNAAVGTDGLLAIMHNSQIERLVRLN